MSLTAQEWARVEVLFPQASTVPGAERAAYLDQHCGNEPRVRQEIEAMLAADTGDDWLKRPVSVNAPERMADTLPAGTRLGAWEIKGLIGHGGMGQVYLAERADGAFSMRAAIKLLKRELIADRNAERFLRERRVLAGLSHPNIARALDAGATGDGHPYLVMEYVRGTRITDHCTRQSLEPKAVVLLMQAVAEAVAEAHRQRIVHRDLKPANVLVTQDGQVKLLDFGIAKLLDEPDTAGSLPMTPAYAAPEQILGQDPTPASDVYALGVMLFQLLTQRLPHRREGLPLPVIAASLGAETTERPSQVVLRTEGLLSTAQRMRQAEALTGDLDWIALKALQADPSRRYQSAGELAGDIDRYLERRPVLARPDSVIYRATRFTQRYPTQVAASLLAVVALTTGLASALWQASVARLEATRATEEAQRAEAQTARTRRVKDFLVSVFLQEDPLRSDKRGPLTMAEAIEGTIARINGELSGDKELQAELLDDFGEIVATRGDFEAAQKMFAHALAVAIEVHGPDHPSVAESSINLGILASYRGSTRDGAAHLERAMEILRRLPDADPEMLASAISGLTALRQDESRLDEALALTQEGVALRRTTPGPAESGLGSALQNLGVIMAEQHRWAEARVALDESVAVVERNAGPQSAQLIPVMVPLSRIAYAENQPARQMEVLDRGLRIARATYPDDHPWTADLLSELGRLHSLRGNLKQGEAMLREALAMRERLGDDTASFTKVYLVETLWDDGRRDEALALAEDGLADCARLKIESTKECLDLRADRLSMEVQLGKSKQALAETQALLDALQAKSLAATKLYGDVLTTQAQALAGLRRWPEALAAQNRAIAVKEDIFGAQHPESLAARSRLTALQTTNRN